MEDKLYTQEELDSKLEESLKLLWDYFYYSNRPSYVSPSYMEFKEWYNLNIKTKLNT